MTFTESARAYDALLGFGHFPLPNATIRAGLSFERGSPVTSPAVAEPAVSTPCVLETLRGESNRLWMSGVPVPVHTVGPAIPFDFSESVRIGLARQLDVDHPAFEVGAVIGWIRRIVEHIAVNGLVPVAGHQLQARRVGDTSAVEVELDGRLRFLVTGVPVRPTARVARPVAMPAASPAPLPVPVEPEAIFPVPVGTRWDLPIRRFRLSSTAASHVVFARVSPDGRSLYVPGLNHTSVSEFREGDVRNVHPYDTPGDAQPRNFGGPTREWITVNDRSNRVQLMERTWHLSADGMPIDDVDRTSDAQLVAGENWNVSAASANGRSVLLTRFVPVWELYWIDWTTRAHQRVSIESFGSNERQALSQTGFSTDGQSLWILMQDVSYARGAKQSLFVVSRNGGRTTSKLVWEGAKNTRAPLVQFSHDATTLYIIHSHLARVHIVDVRDLDDPLRMQTLHLDAAVEPTALEITQSAGRFLLWSPNYLGVAYNDHGNWRIRETALPGRDARSSFIRCVRIGPMGDRAMVGMTNGVVHTVAMRQYLPMASPPLTIASETTSIDAIAFLPSGLGYFAILGDEKRYSAVMLRMESQDP